MNRHWGVPVMQDERLRVETITNGVADEQVPTSQVLGKRYAATSPNGLDEVLGLQGAQRDASTLVDGPQEGVEVESDAKPRRQRKHRKSTHTVRKEEKERLLKEMEALNAQLKSLKQQAMAAAGKVDRDTAQSIQVGRDLREDVQLNQQKFGEVACIMSEFSICNAQAGSPLHDFMELKRDLESRRTLLRSLKTSKLQKAEHFLQLRRPRSNLQTNIDEGRRFEMDNGDFFSERLSVAQLRDARNVKQTYDLLLLYYCNLEISISEKIGHITVREDEDNGSKNIRQNHLVSTACKGYRVESNTITFSQFYERDDENNSIRGESDFGIIVMDYVDEDEKYPYQTDRIRKDIIAVIEIHECKRSSGSNEEKVVVLTRWVQNKLHRPNFPMELKEWYELRDHMGVFAKTIQRTLSEDLHLDIGVPHD